jgi:hypothetical protein
MKTLKTLKPGPAGTKALLARYGASLLRVRYRYTTRRRGSASRRSSWSSRGTPDKPPPSHPRRVESPAASASGRPVSASG